MINHSIHLNKNIFADDQILKSTRQAFGDAVNDIASANKDLVVLSADLSSSLKLEEFKINYPDRFIQCGIAEQNMAGIATGLALTNKTPFITSFACFIPSRNWDQIRVSIAQQCANVKIVGSHSGFSHASDGRSAQAFEDVALTRVLPNISVVQPIDYNQTIKAVKQIANTEGPFYLRLHREKLPNITTKNTPFEIGKANILVYGEDITVISSGPIATNVLRAVNDLKAKYKINCELIDLSTIKPLDKETILESVKKTKKVVTVEEHQIAGGMGSAVAEFLSYEYPVKILRLGVNDEFGMTGEYQELLDFYKLSSHNLEEQIYTFYKK